MVFDNKMAHFMREEFSNLLHNYFLYFKIQMNGYSFNFTHQKLSFVSVKIFRLYALIFCFLFWPALKGQYRYSYLVLGKREFRDQNFVEAINYFNYYINEYPGFYEAYYLRGLSKYNLSDLSGAEIDLSKSIACLPEYSKLYMVRGVIRSEKFHLIEASQDFNKALVLDSTNYTVYIYRALNNLDLGKYDSALDDVNKFIESDPKNTGIFLLRGEILAQQQNFSGAIQDFTTCVDANNKDAIAFVNRGMVYKQINKSDSALNDFNKALAIDSSNAYVYFQRGLLKMQSLNYQAALTDMNRAIELSPENELAYYNRAMLKSTLQNETDAVDDFIHILHQNPDNMLVYYNMGISLSRIGRLNEALRSFDKATELFPDYAAAWYQKALIKKTLGDKKGASGDLQKFDQINLKNKSMSDTLKNKEGLEILKLTHLSNDFLNDDEKKSKIQYNEADINLKPIFQLVIDSFFVVSSQNFKIQDGISFQVKSRILYSDKISSDSALIYNQIVILDSLLKTDENNMNLYLKRGILLLSIDNPEKAVEDLSIALSYHPNNLFIYFNLANARITLLDKMISEKEQNSYHFSESEDVEINHLYFNIRFDLEKILEMNPEFSYALYNLGCVQFMMGNYNEAIDYFTKVTKEQKMSEAYFNKGLLFVFLKQKEEGCRDLSTAGALGDKDAYSIIRKFCN
jgi:tetratricopeptide (TPR) repeat protein